ncbi:MAG TPA: carboxyl-terminal processing protease CtpA [Allocoleopsis sp.]
MYKKTLRTLLVAILSVILSLNIGINAAFALTSEQQLILEVWRIVNRSYVDSTFNHHDWSSIRQTALKENLETRAETYKTIQKMLSNLDDPFTRLLKPDQYRSLQANTSGELTGVGLQIIYNKESKVIEVISPIVGSPADKAGIKPRDRILKIDDVSTSNISLDEAAGMMRGKIGTSVTLTIQTDNEPPHPVYLVRSRIALNPVFSQLDTQLSNYPIGYIRLSQFSANAPKEINKAITNLKQEGAKAYILDLRNNPGGLLQAGIEIARLWLNTGTIVYTVNRQGIVGSFEANQTAITDAPLVILVNQGTASASEILAGALQDQNRAKLVGQKTFGKGLIQSLFDLSDDSGLAVTIAKYETPNHHDINKLGIQPDQVVDLEPITLEQVSTSADTQYQAALELLKSSN